MRILFSGLSIFMLALCIHLVIWRIRVPWAQTKALLQIFLGTLFIYFILLWLSPLLAGSLGNYTYGDFLEYLHIALFVISLTLAYIATYSALEVDSPSLLIIMNIASFRLEGFTEENLRQITRDDLLIEPRVNDLLADGLIYLHRNKYRLTWKGILVTKIFIFYRELLHLKKGG